MTIIVKQTAKGNINAAMKEAKRSTLLEGITKVGIKFKRMSKQIILF